MTTLRRLAAFFLPLFALTFYGCHQAGPVSNDSGESKPLVIVSIPPYATMVKQIAGDTVEVRTIAKEGVDPHIFEPKPRAISEYKDAKLWIGVGEPFESKLYGSLERMNPGLEYLNLITKVPLLSFSQDTSKEVKGHKCSKCKKDRHIWLNPIMVIQQMQIIATALSKINPHDASLYARNLYQSDTMLHELNGKITSMLKPYSNTAILATHPAWGYFCHQYNIVQLSFSSDEEHQVRPQELTSICELSEKYDVRVIVEEPGHDIKAVKSYCEMKNIREVTINSFAGDYVKTMEDLATAIVGPDHGSK